MGRGGGGGGGKDKDSEGYFCFRQQRAWRQHKGLRRVEETGCWPMEFSSD